MKKPLIIVIILVVVIFGGTFAYDIFRVVMEKRQAENFQAPPQAVSSAVVKSETWHPKLHSVGTLTAINGVDVSSEVSGQIMKIYFHSGQMVKQGDPLIQLDDSLDQEQLRNDQAALALNKLTFQRRGKLLRTGAVSKSEFDQAEAAYVQSQAAVKSSEVKISKKHIVAPFAGKVGIRLINLGQYVNPGDPLATLQSMDPLFVDFDLPEQDLKDVHVGQKVQVGIEAYPNQKFDGEITAVNSKVSTSTRTFLVRATFPNHQGKLYPGVFTNVDVILPETDNVVTIPQPAITYSLYGDTVFLIENKGKDKTGKPKLVVKQQYVKLGPRIKNKVAVLDGLKPGQVVVASGQLKLQPGSTVVINNKVDITGNSGKFDNES